jgi:hypothetical protein
MNSSNVDLIYQGRNVQTTEDKSDNREMKVTRSTLSDNEEDKNKIDSIPQEMQCINNVEMCINIQDNTRKVKKKHHLTRIFADYEDNENNQTRKGSKQL